MGKEKLLRFIPVLVICGLFSLLSVALVGQQFYGRYTPREKMIDVLPAGSFQVEGADSDAECLVLVNSKEANSVMAEEDIRGLFEQIKVDAEFVDLSKETVFDYTGYDNIVFAMVDSSLLGQTAYEILDWVQNGGGLMVYFPPQGDYFFRSLASQLGVQESGLVMYEVPGFRFRTDLMLGGQGKDFIIEEPFDKTLFLMVSEHPEQLLATIQSRLQRITVPPLPQEEIRRQLVEQKGVAEALAVDYAHVAAGDWHRALRLLDESEEQIYNQEKFISLMRLCWARQMLPVNAWVGEMADLGRERQKSFLAHAVRMIRENFIRNFHADALNYMTEREKEFSLRFAPYVNEGNVIPLSEEFERAYNDINRNGNSKIILTDLCIKVMQNIRPH